MEKEERLETLCDEDSLTDEESTAIDLNINKKKKKKEKQIEENKHDEPCHCRNCYYWDGDDRISFGECKNKEIVKNIRGDFETILEFNKNFGCVFWKEK